MDRERPSSSNQVRRARSSVLLSFKTVGHSGLSEKQLDTTPPARYGAPLVRNQQSTTSEGTILIFVSTTYYHTTPVWPVLVHSHHVSPQDSQHSSSRNRFSNRVIFNQPVALSGSTPLHGSAQTPGPAECHSFNHSCQRLHLSQPLS